MEALGLIAATLGAPPRPQQGLLIAKTLYEQLGGHRGEDADPEGFMTLLPSERPMRNSIER